MGIYEKTKKDVQKLTGSKRERAEYIVAKLSFYEVELAKLEKIIATKGWVEEYQNGANQNGVKKSTEGEMYNSIMKNYSSLMKQLEDMLDRVPDDEDAIDKFLNGRT